MQEIETKTDETAGKEADHYIIHIENFEGPLDLLWSLIKNAKIDITEVSISHITEQYIQYLKRMEAMKVQVASEFIVMASDLLYYKSRALLPGGDIEDEYFVPPLPPELIQKLLEYKKYQNASLKMRERFETQSDTYARMNIQKEISGEGELIEVSLFDLLSAFADVMDKTVVVEQKEIIFDEILVSDRINYVFELLKQKEQVLFTELFTAQPMRMEIVATFLAILEMAKMRRIKIMQHRVFGDIRIIRAFTVEAV